MNIVITRYRKTSETIDSRLTVGMRICDCAENAIIALKAGTYPLNVVKCVSVQNRCKSPLGRC